MQLVAITIIGINYLLKISFENKPSGGTSVLTKPELARNCDLWFYTKGRFLWSCNVFRMNTSSLLVFMHIDHVQMTDSTHT